MQSLRIEVYGKVQGVYFRAQTLAKAKELGIKGCVWNRDDGSVEIRAEGETEPLIHLVNWCRRGPLFARVDRVSTEEVPQEGYSEFQIR